MRRQGHVRHFVKVERAAIGQLQQAGPHELAIGLFTKQFLFETFRRDARRIDDHKGVIRARAPAVEQTRGHFLTCTCRA